MRANMLRVSSGGPISLVYSTENTDAGGAWSINITGLGHRSGDLGVLVFTGDTSDGGTVTVTPTVTNHARYTNGSNGLYGEVSTFVMDGTETAISGDNGATLEQTTIVFFVLRNATVADATSATGSLGAANPPSITGVGISDWVVCAGCVDVTDSSTSPPSGFTMIEDINKDAGGAARSTTMTAYQTDVSGTIDPGTFTHTTGRWLSATLRIAQA